MLRWIFLLALLTSVGVDAFGADPIADAFGVSLGVAVDSVIDASALEVKEEGKGICRYVLNGSKILHQKSCMGFEVSDLLTRKGEKEIEGFVVTSKGVFRVNELDVIKNSIIKKFPELNVIRVDKEKGAAYYSYETEARQKRIVYCWKWGKPYDYHLSMAVYTMTLASSERKSSTNLDLLIKACVTIATDSGVAGSGVIVDEFGDLYLFTNRHVIEGAREITAKLQSGEEVALDNLQVSKSLDLARFKIKSSGCCGLKIEQDIPKIGETVIVLGNSLGAGAITRTKGRVLGVGADVIEVDAGFVQGNSGGPIINGNGNLIAIATFLLKVTDRVDWKIRGTRFEAARRFGLRPCVNDWSNISLNLLNRQYRSFCNVVASVVLLTITDFVLGDEYPMKKLEIDFEKLNNSGVDVGPLKKYKHLVGCYNAMQQKLQNRDKIEQQVVRYLQGYGNIEIPRRVSKHGNQNSVLYKLNDGFVRVVEEFCERHNMRVGESCKGLLREWKDAQSRLLAAHNKYQKTMTEDVDDLKAKLSKSFEVNAYNDEAHKMIKQVDRFIVIARDNKYK